MRRISSIPLFPTLAVLAVVVAGCGGGGGGTADADAKLTFTAGAGYNGSSARLSGNPSSSVTNGTTVVLVAQGARTLAVTLPTTTPQNGSEYTVGQGGANVRYSESVFGAADNVWLGNGGLIKVQFLRNTLFLQLSNVTFAADATAGSQAQGSFNLSGSITNVAF